MTPQELKNSILHMAIQGKLVEQRPEEGTAEELYQRIQEEKQRLIRSGKIKKEKPLPEISEDEKPFEIPVNWLWTRFGELGSYKKGPFGSALTKSMFVPKGKDTIKVYEQKNAIQKDAKLGEYFITREYFESKMKGFEVFSGDIIVSCAGTIGETYIMPENLEQGIINQALMRMKLFKPIYIPYFLIYFDFVLKKDARSSSKGSAIKNIPPFDILKNYLVPLPPLAEQKRIVAQIEKLLPYIDRYEQAWSRLETFNKRFPEDMKKTILHVAIQGKLVEQRSEEGTAEELYQQIQIERQQLIKAGKIKMEKPLPEVSEDEKPFDIPENWEWVRLGDVITLLSGTDFKPDEYNEQGAGIPYITGASSLSSDGVLVNRWTEKPKVLTYYGDVLLVCKGSGYGKAVFCNIEKAHIARQIMAIKKIDTIYMQYIRYFLMARITQIKSNGQGVIPGIDRTSVLNMVFPLPPLAEQKRIVARLEKLLPLCEMLK